MTLSIEYMIEGGKERYDGEEGIDVGACFKGT
jgi:hypothetical protein